MIYTIALILVALWLAGFIMSFMLGGAIHLLLAIAVIAIVIKIMRRNNVRRTKVI